MYTALYIFLSLVTAVIVFGSALYYGTSVYELQEKKRNDERRRRRPRRLRAFIRLVRRYGNNTAKLPRRVRAELNKLVAAEDLELEELQNGDVRLFVAE